MSCCKTFGEKVQKDTKCWKNDAPKTTLSPPVVLGNFLFPKTDGCADAKTAGEKRGPVGGKASFAFCRFGKQKISLGLAPGRGGYIKDFPNRRYI